MNRALNYGTKKPTAVSQAAKKPIVNQATKLAAPTPQVRRLPGGLDCSALGEIYDRVSNLPYSDLVAVLSQKNPVLPVEIELIMVKGTPNNVLYESDIWRVAHIIHEIVIVKCDSDKTVKNKPKSREVVAKLARRSKGTLDKISEILVTKGRKGNTARDKLKETNEVEEAYRVLHPKPKPKKK